MAPSQKHLYTGLDEPAMAQMQTGHNEWYVRMNSGNGLDMELEKEAHIATGESEGTNMDSLVRFVAEAE